MHPKKIYYQPAILDYALGKQLREKCVYRSQYRHEAEAFLRQEITRRFACTEILYVV